MECVQSRSINKSLRVADEHLFAVCERADYDGSSISQSNLEDRVAIPAPPFLANSSVVVTKFEQVACNGECTGDLR